ncbi:unnamed protein product [Malus baccata var. baccata]
MGAAKSASSSRRVQPLLPFQFCYHRHSPSDSSVQPLLGNQNQFMEEEVAVALEANGEKNARLEKEIRDIKSNLSRLEAKLHSHRPQPKPQTDQLSMMKKQGEDYEELKRLNADLEDKFMEMASTIADIKCSLSGLMLQMPAASSTTSKSSMSESGIYAEEDEDDDQIASLLANISTLLIVLVFLMSILIGFRL